MHQGPDARRTTHLGTLSICVGVVLLQVLVLGREKEGIPPEIISMLDATVEIPQLGVIRSLNVHVSGAIAMYEFTKQQLAARQS